MHFIAPPKHVSTIESLFDFSVNNSYIALYPELFLIIIISLLIAFLVIIDYANGYKLLLSNLTANILI